MRAIVVTGAGKAFCIGGDGTKLSDAASSGGVQATNPYPYCFPMVDAGATRHDRWPPGQGGHSPSGSLPEVRHCGDSDHSAGAGDD